MARPKRWRVRGWSLMLLLLAPILSGCSQEEKAGAELAAIDKEYEEAEGYIAERRAAFAPRYQALAKAYWGTEAALDAALWLMEKAASETARSARPGIVAAFTDSILAEYERSPALGKLARYVSLYTPEQREHYFGKLRETSPHPAVRAAATFYPAQLKMRSLRPRLPLPGMPTIPAGKTGGDPQGLEEVEADLRLVMEQYGDLPVAGSTYGVMADALVNAYTAAELAVGKPTPEMVGKTVDGEELRLSDFLGKVTVIDFWGDW